MELILRQHTNFFNQKIKILYDNTPRYQLLEKYCQNKKVLHFGCVDSPIFNPNHNLHLYLSKCCTIHGFDIDINGLEELKKYYNEEYFNEFDQLKDKKYDLVLLPETIEHVDNVEIFLKNIEKINFNKMLISAPCFYGAKYKLDNNVCEETVHPDHNCWHSPYTLCNIINKFTNLIIENVYLIENNSMILLECRK